MEVDASGCERHPALLEYSWVSLDTLTRLTERKVSLGSPSTCNPRRLTLCLMRALCILCLGRAAGAFAAGPVLARCLRRCRPRSGWPPCASCGGGGGRAGGGHVLLPDRGTESRAATRTCQVSHAKVLLHKHDALRLQPSRD